MRVLLYGGCHLERDQFKSHKKLKLQCKTKIVIKKKKKIWPLPCSVPLVQQWRRDQCVA